MELYRCCQIHSMMNEIDEVARNLSDYEANNKLPTNIDVPDQKIISYGAATAIGIAIGVFLLVIGCIMAFRIGCSGFSNRSVSFPSIVRQSTSAGESRRATVVTLPVRSSNQSSQVHITITSDSVTSIRYSSSKRSLRPVADEEPPKYEDINAVSFPTSDFPSSPRTDDPLLPTYNESSNM